MNKIILEIANRIGKVDDPYESCIKLLDSYEMNQTTKHVINVSRKAIDLADMFGEDKERAKIARILHDVSCIIPNDKRVELANFYNIELFEEEEIFPMIIHQRLSKEISSKYFNINDHQILDAISCHTTLKANPSKLDMIIFIADKIEWDQPGEPPYKNLIMNGLNVSLESGVYNFIKHLIDNKNNLRVVHPWLAEAYEHFTSKE